MSWAIHIPLQAEESVSSWLARAALLQGCDPLALTGSVWPGLRIWTMDADRGMSNDHFQALSKVCGISATQFDRVALRIDVERITGRTLTDTESWPWVLTLGARNRRRHSGQQFCPDCLASDPHPHFRRQWRFAWHVACARHGTNLIDHCSTCEAPIAPHLLAAEDRQLAFCSRCRADLREMPAASAPDGALAFQHAADQVVRTGTGSFGKETLSVPSWFATARFYIGMVRQAARRNTSKLAAGIRSLGVDVNASHLPLMGLPLELLPAADRSPLLGATRQLMALGPESLHVALKHNAVTAISACDPRSLLPASLKEAIASLPHGQHATRRPAQTSKPRPRTEATVRGAWMRLQRKAKAGLL